MSPDARALSEAEREATRRRLRFWQEAQAALEEQHWRELVALTDERALQLTRALLSRRLATQRPSDWSGLVEQQALFQRVGR